MKFAEFAGTGTTVQLHKDYSPAKKGGWEFKARKIAKDGTVLKEMLLLTYLDPETEIEVLEGGVLDTKFNVVSKSGTMIIKTGEKVDMSRYGDIKS